jgi:hypothetical protein
MSQGTQGGLPYNFPNIGQQLPSATNNPTPAPGSNTLSTQGLNSWNMFANGGSTTINGQSMTGQATPFINNTNNFGGMNAFGQPMQNSMMPTNTNTGVAANPNQQPGQAPALSLGGIMTGGGAAPAAQQPPKFTVGAPPVTTPPGMMQPPAPPQNTTPQPLSNGAIYAGTDAQGNPIYGTPGAGALASNFYDASGNQIGPNALTGFTPDSSWTTAQNQAQQNWQNQYQGMLMPG